MSDEPVDYGGLIFATVFIVGLIAAGYIGMESPILLLYLVASLVPLGWAVVVIVLLVKILNRLPVAEEKNNVSNRAEPTGALDGAGPGNNSVILEVKRDERGRILADE